MDPVGYSTGKHGGSVREAGGAMGSMAFASEEKYFRELEQKQLENIRQQMQDRETNQQHANENNQEKTKNN